MKPFSRCPARLPATAAVALLYAAAAQAQFVPAENANHDAMYRHFMRAKEIAGLDLYPHFANACIVDQHYRWTISRGIQQAGDIRPLQVMDNLDFLGQNAVSSWAIRTSEGIVLIDALNNTEEAQKYIVGGMRETCRPSASTTRSQAKGKYRAPARRACRAAGRFSSRRDRA